MHTASTTLQAKTDHAIKSHFCCEIFIFGAFFDQLKCFKNSSETILALAFRLSFMSEISWLMIDWINHLIESRFSVHRTAVAVAHNRVSRFWHLRSLNRGKERNTEKSQNWKLFNILKVVFFAKLKIFEQITIGKVIFVKELLNSFTSCAVIFENRRFDFIHFFALLRIL